MTARGDVSVNNDQSVYRCPKCRACDWRAELWLPGGLNAVCNRCDERVSVSAIEHRAAEIERLRAKGGSR